MGHSNCGSTPHSNRTCRLSECGRAYELPQRTQEYAPPVVAGTVGIWPMCDRWWCCCCDIGVLAEAVVATAAVRPHAMPLNSVAGTLEMTAEAVASICFKHVFGVISRRSHGWSSSLSDASLLNPVGEINTRNFGIYFQAQLQLYQYDNGNTHNERCGSGYFEIKTLRMMRLKTYDELANGACVCACIFLCVIPQTEHKRCGCLIGIKIW
jgi:hypothetical protein